MKEYIEKTFQVTDEMESLKGMSRDNSPDLHALDAAIGDPGDVAEGYYKFHQFLHNKFDQNKENVTSGDTKRIMEALKSFFSGFAETFERYDNSGNIMADLQILEEITANGGPSHPGENGGEGASEGESVRTLEDNADTTQTIDKAAKATEDMFGFLDFEGLLQSGRDSLYTASYVMNMFSYETSHLEGMYHYDWNLVEGEHTDLYKTKTTEAGSIRSILSLRK